jgi:hypothetical protein
MTEQDKTTSMIVKSETEEMESKDKDKDKLKDNDLKSLFNVVVNNYNENRNDSESNKRKQNQVYRKISFKNYFSKLKRNYKLNTQEKEKDNSLNNDKSNEDLLTIINSSKIHSLPHFLFSRDKKKFPKKKKGVKVEMFYSKKYKNIKPQKDYYLRNNNSSLFSTDEENKFKNNSVKLRNNRTFGLKMRGASPLGGGEDKKKPKSKKKEKSREGLESKNSKVTCYLDRRKINDLPIIYPLFLSYNNSYNTFSEKNRVEKILNKFVCLKTQIIKDYKNRDRIMREFMVRNGVYDKKYFTEKKLSSFNEYLKKPFKFDPKKTIIDIIKEAVNYQYDEVKNDENKLKPVNMFINHNIVYTNKPLRRSKNNSYDNINSEKLYKNPICLKVDELNFDENHLPILVNELEENLRQIQYEGAERLNKLRGGTKKLKKYKIKDNNKFVPNLCLVNQEFKEKYEHIIDKENKKLMENYNRSQHIQEINDRMYYNNIKKRLSDQNFTDEIRRKLKLTEYIIVQRARKKMALSQFNKFTKDDMAHYQNV